MTIHGMLLFKFRDATDRGPVRFRFFYFGNSLFGFIIIFFWKWAFCFDRLFCLFGVGVYQGDHEEIEEDNSRAEFLCPFCAEDFDIVGLYCHVDEEHPVEVKNAVRIFDNFDL